VKTNILVTWHCQGCNYHGAAYPTCICDGSAKRATGTVEPLEETLREQVRLREEMGALMDQDICASTTAMEYNRGRIDSYRAVLTLIEKGR
jgi:hypothetical protein